MKGKFRILGHIGIGAFMVCAMMLALIPAAPVAAATAVTSVWVEFPFTDASNDNTNSTTNVYIIHFKPTTALVRGVDYVTVTFPDGSTAMGGDGTVGGDYAFTVSAPAAADVLFSTDYNTTEVLTGASWYSTTTTPTVGGYRAKVLVPIDVSASADVWVKFDDYDDSGAMTSAATEASTYKVYVATTKDTTPVLSSAFAIGESTVTDGSTAMETSYPVPTTAGSTAEYILDFKPTAAVTGTSGKVTVMFPVGTVLPSSISATNVQFSTGGGSYSPCSTTPVVDTDRRMITAIPSTTLTANTAATMKILAGAGIINPNRAADASDASAYTFMVRTSADGQWNVSNAYEITFGSSNKVVVGNGEIGTADTIGSGGYYSDNATMINMYSSQIYVVLADANGNGITPSSTKTLNISSSSTTGTFATNAAYAGTGAWTTGVTSTTIGTTNSYDPCLSDGITTQIFYYKDSTAGTHTLTFSASDYTSATWTITVAPAVSLYDANNNLINTYAPGSTQSISETGGTSYTQKYPVDYINDAMGAAMAGDTIKLGDGIYEVDSTAITVSKAITLTSVNGAASTTIRNVGDEIDKAVEVTGTGTATNPIIISGFTFTRLRATVDIDCAIRNTAGDYVTVQNCVFSYIIPDEGSDTEAVVWFQAGSRAITSCTISNNTFSNCVGFNAIDSGNGRTGCIVFDNGGSSYNMTGVTVSGNILTNCNDYGIAMGAGSHTVKATVSNNTITNGYSAIDLAGHSDDVSVTGNTITSPYNYGVLVELGDNAIVTIKNNTITGCAGTNGAIRIPDETDAVVTVQYNDITGTNIEGYAIKADHAAPFDCRYNWFGSATGPNYTALTGATVGKSNPNGTGDKISDYVTYYPWLHKSRADVVADNASYQSSVMKLVVGWNTLSTPVPLIAAADSVAELIPSGSVDIAYYYDGSWQQILTEYTLSPCDAVYVKMLVPTYVQLKFETKTFSTPSKALAVGWNLCSLAALDSSGMEADDAVASVYKTAANLPGYAQVISPSLNANRYDMYYNVGTSWTYSSGQTATIGSMFAGMGYWVYMQNAATLAGFEITPIAPDLD
jgi:hypothetical protein